LGAALALVAAPALAQDAACWFENGAVVAPAEVAGIAGDYLLDPSTPVTEIHETRAQGAGFSQTALVADARVGGLSRAGLPVRVVDLDSRSAGFDTPIAGVIGADLLAGQVVELSFAPCRLSIHRPGPAARARRGEQVLAVELVGGVPAVRAAASDDDEARAGLFAVDFSAQGLVRFSDRVAGLEPKRQGVDPLARNVAPGRVRALSVAGRLYEEAPAGLAAGLDPRLSGALGVGLWSRWRLRLDMAHATLTLIPPA
jgi:hypothetical protein